MEFVLKQAEFGLQNLITPGSFEKRAEVGSAILSGDSRATFYPFSHLVNFYHTRTKKLRKTL